MIGSVKAFICTALAAAVIGQSQQPPPPFRTGVDLATIDVVVVDGNGRHVTDLTSSDFELTADRRVLPLRQAVYVHARPDAADALASGAGSVPARDLGALGLPAGAPRPQSTARTIAVVVDDLELSFESMVYARKALHEFIDRQVQPGDLVAILRTAGGVGALQQFTTDKRILKSAAESVQWTPVIRGPAADDSLESFRRTVLATGTLGTVDAAVRGLQHLPGRKALVLLSEGFDLNARRSDDPRGWSALMDLIDRANQAGVVLNAIDVRGLIYVRPGAESRALLNSQEGLRFLAQQTGGLAVVNNNSIALGLQRIIEDQQGYYLLGYEPPPQQDDRRRLVVRVKRPGLQVRARQGLFGPATARPIEQVTPLELAARSPFGAGAITMRLTTLFGYDETDGPYVHALVLLDAGDLTFTRAADHHEAHVNLLLLALGENGRVAARWQQEDLTIRLSDEDYATARERGLVRSVRFLARTPAPYQIRAAVEDRSTGALGSGSQFLIVPKVGRGRLGMSGVLMRYLAREDDESEAFVDVLGQPTIRVFRPGTEALYAFEVYDGLSPDEAIATTTVLLRDGREVYRSPISRISSERRRDRFNRIPIGGTLTLGRAMPVGAYVLQVSVGRLRRGQLDVIATQWADFELQ